MLDMNMIWEKIKEQVKCATCNRHWYILAAIAVVAVLGILNYGR